MKRIGKAKTWILSAIALALVAVVTVPSALAYFSANDQSRGQKTLEFETPDIDLKERFADWTKFVTISNKSEKTDCYIRVKAIAPSDIESLLEFNGEGWELKSDGYAYYNEVVPAGAETKTLEIKIPPQKVDENNPVDFNVVVVQEAIPVKHDETGKPYADWNISAEEYIPTVQ